MNKGFINLGLVVVVLVAIGLGYFVFVRKPNILVTPEPPASPMLSESTSPKPSNIPPELLPLPANFKWSGSVKADYSNYLIYERGEDEPIKVSLKGYEVKAESSNGDFNFFNYYDRKLTALGWLTDVENTTESIFGNVWGYTNDDKHILFQKEIKYYGREIPESPYNCPCTYTYRIFIEN